MMYVETTRRNYGNAQGYAQSFFDQARQLAAQTTDPGRKKTLDDVLKTRDAIVAALARSDPAALADIQSVLTSVETASQS